VKDGVWRQVTRQENQEAHFRNACHRAAPRTYPHGA